MAPIREDRIPRGSVFDHFPNGPDRHCVIYGESRLTPGLRFLELEWDWEGRRWIITRDLLWVPDEGYRIIQMKTIPGDPPSSILVILQAYSEKGEPLDETRVVALPTATWKPEEPEWARSLELPGRPYVQHLKYSDRTGLTAVVFPVGGFHVKSMKICLIEPDDTLFSFRDLPVPPLSQGRYHYAGFLDSNLEDLDHVIIKGLNNLCLYDLAR